ncbi:MAG: FeoB-associated Cys-rich membrane protein, partial [Firmicutes bacterium]|nr:FeoB-associated Cys-rich membrane protein [Bacillota bacterium]
MTDLIVGGILLVILGLAIAYIVKEKKAGAVCVGCPHAGSCWKPARSSPVSYA